MRKNQLEFTYMRGIAIIFIVLGHSIYNSGEGFPLLLENLLRGGTALFVFISGYFFHRIFYKDFDYGKFMKNKVQNVLYPFLIVSFVGLFCFVLRWIFLEHQPVEKVLLYIYYTVRNGYILYPHWYIPFIMAVFLFSPIFLWFIRCSQQMRWTLFIISCVVAILMHRPIGNVNFIHSLVYFMPFYLIGILYSQDEHVVSRYGSIFSAIAAILVLVSLVEQSYISVHIGNYHKAPFEYNGIDWQFIQKLGLCILVLNFCEWLSTRSRLPWLVETAEMSFAIFFIHPLFDLLFNSTMTAIRYRLPPGSWVTSILFSAGIFIFLMVGSILTAKYLKKRLGNRSRMVIGW
ncbi:acyltransferase family protein [Shewanella acanthi]|uniref:acyltransferase family protein n=1 Tax=Shewanella acanthi TaxID=2864212 RepID=UPI001C655984|nr:acyltransferase [Shewanella acanthi]QYJ78604.1 acyltransferase [Shewanella acanthi]